MILDNSAIRLVPGSDESELYVSWHCPTEAPAAMLLFSSHEDMTNPMRFEPIVSASETPEYRINRTVVKGLVANTQYYYAVSYGGSITGDVYPFHTRDGKHFSALFATDVQLGWSSDDDYDHQLKLWEKTISTATDRYPELAMILHSGDQTTTGRRIDEWWGYYAPDALRSVPIFSVMGNHDRKGDTINYYTYYPNEYDMKYPSRPNKSDISSQPPFGRDSWFRYGDVLFVHFDSTCGSAKDHLGCALAAKRANPDVKWTVGLMHHDLYGASDSAIQAESTVLFRQIYTPIFDRLGFDFILTGHSHTYSRSHQIFNRKYVSETLGKTDVVNPVGTVYISGCCGANKYDQSVDRIPWQSWTAYRYDKHDNVSTVISFDDGEKSCVMTAVTYECKTGEIVDSYKITKTMSKVMGGGKLENALSNAKFRGVRVLCGVYMTCDTAFRYFEGKKAKKNGYEPHEPVEPFYKKMTEEKAHE